MKLSDYMAGKELDDQALADELGVDRSTIFRVRKGTHKPSPALMAQIAKLTEGAVLPNDYFDDLPEAA